MAHISITRPREDDLPAVAALAWPETAVRRTKHDMVRSWFDLGQLVIAKHDGQVVGLIVADESFFDQTFVRHLAVAENHRRLGLGTALLRATTERIKTERLFTATRESNFPMRMLLASLHWENVGTVRGIDDGASEMFYRAPLAAEDAQPPV
ncbi:GNAT family N-acetyltransferase [Salinibacterium sp. ZJ454]|uniref:GNAT family N-acetyltransferase n=1 Tax=Salinibacterium sp. ZJ454 TaxID=2708339 RepID=UPI001420F707|nr:GNAT family N-acetyltransferase [Salinibacterium sp. ZJ454]